MIARFPIATLRREGVAVWFVIGDQEMIGVVKFTAAGRPRYRLGKPPKTVDLPPHVRPGAWRPTSIETWPDELPEPIVESGAVAWQRPPEPQGSPEAAISDEGWPYPNIRLGRSWEPPKSVEECEARILRAIRTSEVLEWEPTGPAYRWPKDWVIASKVIEKELATIRLRDKRAKIAGLREHDYADFHVDATDARPLPARWIPTPRDVSDCELSGWFRWMPESDANRRFFYMRAARPPFSFKQIGDAIKIPEADIREHYAEVCAIAFERARG